MPQKCKNDQKMAKNGPKMKSPKLKLICGDPHEVYWPKNMLTPHHTKQKSRKTPQKLPKIIKTGKKHKNGSKSKFPHCPIFKFFVVIRDVIPEKMPPILDPVNFFWVFSLLGHCVSINNFNIEKKLAVAVSAVWIIFHKILRLRPLPFPIAQKYIYTFVQNLILDSS